MTELKELTLSRQVLKEVLSEKKPFSDCLRDIFQNSPDIKPLRSTVAALSGGAIRHYFLLAKALEKNVPEIVEDSERHLAMLAVSNAYYVKRLDLEAVNLYLAEILGAEKAAKIEELSKKDPSSLFPEKLHTFDTRYISLRYNVPSWALKIMAHFGAGAAHKVIRAFYKPTSPTFRVKTSMVPFDQVVASSEHFKPLEGVPGMVTYVGKTSFRNLEAWQRNHIFLEKPMTKNLVDMFPLSEPQELLLYTANEDESIVLELLEKYGHNLGMNIGVPSLDHWTHVRRLIKKRELTNVNFFDAKPDSLLSAISKPQDLVIVIPNSTNFDLIPTTPEYLLNYNRDGMDELIALQKETLEQLSKFVQDDGILLYVVYTMSKKEGRRQVMDFLSVHPEFYLMDDRQVLPTDADSKGTLLYYAALRKGQKEEVPQNESLGE